MGKEQTNKPYYLYSKQFQIKSSFFYSLQTRKMWLLIFTLFHSELWRCGRSVFITDLTCYLTSDGDAARYAIKHVRNAESVSQPFHGLCLLAINVDRA
jgi:hypothetical protein